jgi:hypothetical protein
MLLRCAGGDLADADGYQRWAISALSAAVTIARSIRRVRRAFGKHRDADICWGSRWRCEFLAPVVGRMIKPTIVACIVTSYFGRSN